MRHPLACAVTLLAAWAAALPAQEAGPVRLRVKPVLCILDRGTADCATVFRTHWWSEKPGSYCLRNDLEAAPLRCWTSMDEGNHSDERAVRETFSYWMSGTDGERRLVTVTVEVMRIDSDDRRRNRRSRHVWDVL